MIMAANGTILRTTAKSDAGRRAAATYHSTTNTRSPSMAGKVFTVVMEAATTSTTETSRARGSAGFNSTWGMTLAWDCMAIAPRIHGGRGRHNLRAGSG